MDRPNSLIPRALYTRQSTTMELNSGVNALNVMPNPNSLRALSGGDGIVLKTRVKALDRNIRKKVLHPRRIARQFCCVCAIKKQRRWHKKHPPKKLTLYISSKWDSVPQARGAPVTSTGTQTMQRTVRRRKPRAFQVLFWVLSCIWHSLPLVGMWAGSYYGYMQSWREPLKSYYTWENVLKHILQKQTYIVTNRSIAIQPYNGLILLCVLMCMFWLFKKI